MYLGGSGIRQDYDQARSLFEKSAQQNNASAKANLGAIYEHGYDGYGVRQDYAQAKIWYEKAAKQNDAIGQFNLGTMYLHGNGIPQDYVKAG